MADLDAEQAFLMSMQDDSANGTPVPATNEATIAVKQQSKTIGGFIDDGEEDSDEEYNPVDNIQEVGKEEEPVSVERGISATSQQTLLQSPASAVTSHASLEAPQTQNHIVHSVVVPQADVPVPPATPQVVGVGNEAETPVNVPTENVAASVGSAPAPTDADATSPSRLPHDRIGLLEDRIKEDPRGDVEAWLSLISEHQKRNRLDEARAVYERFFAVFPQAADQWVAYADMELEQSEFYRVEQIFNKSLLTVPNVHLWSTYLNYVRRRNNLTSDSSGNARQTINSTYDFVLNNIGNDKDSGPLWQDYVQFLRSGPGQASGNSWQDQQKMDTLRKAYQRAICIPTQAVNTLWREYDAFEMGLNKMTGRKFLQEKSPSYMTARSSNTELQNLTRDLNRTTLPVLAPALGFDGDVEYGHQVELWKQWIVWEKEDPLVLKEEDEKAYKARVIYVYKQALMALRFWPEMWCDAADFCFANGLESEGTDFLATGAAANPESCLLAFKRADRVESTTNNEEGEESMVRRGKAIREPYDKTLDALYDLIKKIYERETKAIARIKGSTAAQAVKQEEQAAKQEEQAVKQEDGEIDHNGANGAGDAHTMVAAQIEALHNGNAAQVDVLRRTISFVWIALMRAMRRVQGKGKVGDPVGGSRQIFTDARSRGRITSDVYVASALIEYHCYKDPAATKIFERGMKLFKDDEVFALEYIKHLIAINDITNARAVFETTVNRLAQKPETIPKSKPLYLYFHNFEANYGELSQISKLEQRMRDLFPEDPQLRIFASRFTAQGFDPASIRPVVSPATQAKPRMAMGIPTSVEQRQPSILSSPRPSIIAPYQNTLSPKRPLDDSDTESARPSKIARADSPLKGAAGRRLNAKNQTLLRNELHQQNGLMPVTPMHHLPPPLPLEIARLLSTIPRAETYNAARFNAENMVNLLRTVDLSKATLNRPPVAATPQAAGPYGYPPPHVNYGR